MQPLNGKNCHFFLHICSFTQIYSSMVMVHALKALDESEKTKNLPICCVVFLILFCLLCVFSVHHSSFETLSISSRCVM
jgi:hypothetical protein